MRNIRDMTIACHQTILLWRETKLPLQPATTWEINILELLCAMLLSEKHFWIKELTFHITTLWKGKECSLSKSRKVKHSAKLLFRKIYWNISNNCSYGQYLPKNCPIKNDNQYNQTITLVGGVLPNNLLSRFFLVLPLTMNINTQTQNRLTYTNI